MASTYSEAIMSLLQDSPTNAESWDANTATAVGCLLTTTYNFDHTNKTVAEVLAEPNTEFSTADNYTRQNMGDTRSVVIDTNETPDAIQLEGPEIDFGALGGTNDETAAGALIFFETVKTSDATRVPIAFYSVNFTTTGGNVKLQPEGATSGSWVDFFQTGLG